MDAVAATRSPTVPALAWVLLAVGVLAASSSAIVTRYAFAADPFAISFWRCAAATVLLLPFSRGKLRKLSRKSSALPALAGAFLAVHFATWITSLELTTIAASVLLVSSSPVFVALTSWWILKDRLRTAVWVGIALTFAGTALVAGGDISGSSMEGNLLALAGGVAAAGYVFAGQVSRRELGIVEYAIATYSAAAVVLLALCLLAGTDLWGYDAPTWAAIAALVLGPQLLGHTVLNFVLKDIDATTVSVAIMAEPVIASLLAFVFFTEVPTAMIYPGGAAILAGIYLVSTRRNPPAPALVVE